jgi:hypothetical protein
VNNLNNTGRILAALFSVVFAVLLYPSIVDEHGVFLSLVYTLLGVVVIWLVYFLLGSLFRHLYDAGVQQGRDDNSDFV